MTQAASPVISPQLKSLQYTIFKKSKENLKNYMVRKLVDPTDTSTEPLLVAVVKMALHINTEIKKIEKFRSCIPEAWDSLSA